MCVDVLAEAAKDGGSLSDEQVAAIEERVKRDLKDEFDMDVKKLERQLREKESALRVMVSVTHLLSLTFN